jgi:hypothetical protein
MQIKTRIIFIQFAFLFLLNLCFSNTIYSQSNLSQDTIKVTNQLTDKYLKLPAINNIFYILPPEESYIIDENPDKFGLNSKKYESDLYLRFQSEGALNEVNPDFVLQTRTQFGLLKNELILANDVIVRYIKFKSLQNNDTIINWNMLAGNDFFAIYGNLTYSQKYDKELSDKVEKSFKSIVVTRNPDAKPESNIWFDGEHSLLDLKFIQRYDAYTSSFSEDGLPVKYSKGSKFAVLATPPHNQGNKNDIAAIGIDEINLVLRNRISTSNDKFDTTLSMIPYSVKEDEIDGIPGILFEGVLSTDENRSVIAYFAPANKLFHSVIGICNSDETAEFFEKIRKYKETVKIRNSQEFEQKK